VWSSLHWFSRNFVGTACTKFRRNLSANMANERSRNWFVPLREMWLSLSRYAGSSRPIDDILKRTPWRNYTKKSTKFLWLIRGQGQKGTCGPSVGPYLQRSCCYVAGNWYNTTTQSAELCTVHCAPHTTSAPKQINYKQQQQQKQRRRLKTAVAITSLNIN